MLLTPLSLIYGGEIWPSNVKSKQHQPSVLGRAEVWESGPAGVDFVYTLCYWFDFPVSLPFEWTKITLVCLFKRKWKWIMQLQLWNAASVIYYHTDQLSWMILNFHKVKTAQRNDEQSKVLSSDGEVGKFAFKKRYWQAFFRCIFRVRSISSPPVFYKGTIKALFF